jgi:hypothetical protein
MMSVFFPFRKLIVDCTSDIKFGASAIFIGVSNILRMYSISPKYAN